MPPRWPLVCLAVGWIVILPALLLWPHAPRPAPLPRSGPYVRSARSEVYHRQECPHARRILPVNRVWYGMPAEAEEAGCRPCRHCRPAADGEPRQSTSARTARSTSSWPAPR